jgi:CRP-like cAMP-binding protein
MKPAGNNVMATAASGQPPFWSRLTTNQQNLLKQVSDMQRYEPRAVLMKAGEPSTWIGIVAHGRVRVTGHGAERDRVIAHRHAGDLIGELAAVGSAKRSATITAITTVNALKLTRGQLDRITDHQPRILRVMLAVIAERVVESDRHRIEIDSEAKIKVARALVDSARRTGRRTGQGIVVGIASQDDFASIIGTSRKTVVRVLTELRSIGVVGTRRGAVIVHDLGRLHAIARQP